MLQKTVTVSFVNKSLFSRNPNFTGVFYTKHDIPVHVILRNSAELVEALLNKEFKYMHISYIPIGRSGAAAISDALSKSSVQAVTLSHTSLGYSGVEMIVNAALKNPNIFYLNLANNIESIPSNIESLEKCIVGHSKISFAAFDGISERTKEKLKERESYLYNLLNMLESSIQQNVGLTHSQLEALYKFKDEISFILSTEHNPLSLTPCISFGNSYKGFTNLMKNYEDSKVDSCITRE